MNHPTAPLIPQSTVRSLRPVEHPELSEALTHFCGRGRPDGPHVPMEISAMIPAQRLENILWQQTLRTFVTFSGGDPAVCFTEARQAGIGFMISQRGYQPWGLIFRRQDVYDSGGGPVWHARQQAYDVLRQDHRLRSWAVRLEAGESDWLEERERRIVGNSDVSLLQMLSAGLLVGDPAWTGARWTNLLDASGQPKLAWYYPPLAAQLPRMYWNPMTTQLQQLPPLF